MGYPYTGTGFRTRADLTRQIYQRCETTATLSGSSDWGDNLRVNYCGSGDTYNFSVSATSASTVVVAINQSPHHWGSALQIKANTLTVGTGNDLEIDLPTGNVLRVASSKKYKYDVAPLSLDQIKKLLNVWGRTFKWVMNNQQDVGFIAEDFHQAGLKEFVIYNGPPRLENVESLKYKQLTAGLLELIKDLYRSQKVGGGLYSDEVHEKIKVVTSDYTTEDIRYIITKNNTITLTLDPSKNNRYYIKAMSPTTIKPHYGLIDEEWEEISMGPQSSVEVIWEGTCWYVLSSDGLKNS